VAPDDSLKIGANYTPADGKLQALEGFVSQPGEPADLRRQNYQESVAWYASITADMFAKVARPPVPADNGRLSAPTER
jgi:hypothetical protein